MAALYPSQSSTFQQDLGRTSSTTSGPSAPSSVRLGPFRARLSRAQSAKADTPHPFDRTGVKEPLFRSLRVDYHLRIEAPSDLVRLYPSSPHLLNFNFPSHPAHSFVGKSVAQLKDVGNAAFKAARWIRAKEAYEWAIASLDASSSRSAGDTVDLELLPTLRSNLALTNVKLSLPHFALRAAQSGLSLLPATAESAPPTPLRQKLLYRLALAQSALERFSAALDTLSPLLALDPPDSSATLLAHRLAARLAEQRAGPSPAQLQALFSHAAQDETPDVADYFASSLVAVQPVAGRGNGLVAVAPIARGTLLACFKPLAAAGGAAAGRRRRQFNAGMNLWTRGMDPWAVGEVAAEVLWRAGWDELSGAEGEGGEQGDAEEAGRSAARALRDLWAGDAMRRLSDDAREGRGAVLDPSRAEAIVTFNGFHIEDLASPSSLPGASAPSDAEAAPEESSFHAPTALYPAPASALNHTCAPPTASYTFLRTLFLLRARVDLSPGDELTDAYVDAFDPLEVRADKLAKHGFVCACALCDEERAAGEKARRERERIAQQLDGPAAGDPRAEVERVRRLKQEIEATYAPAPPSAGAGPGRVRPPLYAPARLLSQQLASMLNAGEEERREAVRAELDALEALGAVFAPDEAGGWEKARMVHPPRVGDTNAVLSALFVARLWREMGRDEGTRHWIGLAREIEKGQAGVELFELRYGAWAKRQGLDLAAPAGASR
ncbi:uncharacterized protein JCM10292_001002 [Rhodotorula paludigena]|uniref:uncharacterized protein n=1 Tax=Rhodotorula paludigena TaxID=86838 RepID=UPI003172DB3A